MSQIEKHIDIANFVYEETLNLIADQRKIIFLGSYDKQPMIIILQKKNFSQDDYKNIYDPKSFTQYFENDIYTKYTAEFNKINDIDTQIIYPATPKMINKYRLQNTYIVSETAEFFYKFIKTHIDEQKNIQWIENILEKKSEKERLLYDQEGKFLIIPDFNFSDFTQLNTLHIIALVYENIQSLRDLNQNNLDLLKEIKQKGLQLIKEKYNLNQNKLRIFIHYHPTYYKFHVHFTHIQVANSGVFTERAHLLDSVIQNITLIPDYYQKVALQYTIVEQSPFYKHFVEEKLLEI